MSDFYLTRNTGMGSQYLHKEGTRSTGDYGQAARFATVEEARSVANSYQPTGYKTPRDKQLAETGAGPWQVAANN